MTIDLGFAWTTLPIRARGGVRRRARARALRRQHARRARPGAGGAASSSPPTRAGWRSRADHRDAVAALGIRHGLLVDHPRRPGRPAGRALAQARAQLAGDRPGSAPAVIVSGGRPAPGWTTCAPRSTASLARRPRPRPTRRCGSGSTGRSPSAARARSSPAPWRRARSARGDQLELLGRRAARRCGVRGLQSLGEPYRTLGPAWPGSRSTCAACPPTRSAAATRCSPPAWPAPTARRAPHHRRPAHRAPEQRHRARRHRGRRRCGCGPSATTTPGSPSTGRSRSCSATGWCCATRVAAGPGRSAGPRRRPAAAAAPRRQCPQDQCAGRAGPQRRRACVEVARRGAVEERHLRRLGLLPNEGPETPAGVWVLNGWWVHAPRTTPGSIGCAPRCTSCTSEIRWLPDYPVAPP